MDDVKPFHVINEWNCQCCGNDDRVVLLWWCSVHIVSYMLEQVIACDITHRLELSFICLTRDSLFVGILSVGVHDDGNNETLCWSVISFTSLIALTKLSEDWEDNDTLSQKNAPILVVHSQSTKQDSMILKNETPFFDISSAIKQAVLPFNSRQIASFTSLLHSGR